jgi:hypothetical protein
MQDIFFKETSMKKFLAIYTGTPTSAGSKKWDSMSEADQKKKTQQGMEAWIQWGKKHEKFILEGGGPLGKTKKIDGSGISDIRNYMAAYAVVEAETHEAAAKMFINHPHFAIFPGDSVEIMEVLPVPSM